MMMSSSHFFKYFLFLGQRGPSKVCSVGTRWMWNQIPHPTSSPDRNLSKNTLRYVENTNTKSSFFLSSSKINQYYFIILLMRPILDPKIPLMCIGSLRFGMVEGSGMYTYYLIDFSVDPRESNLVRIPYLFRLRDFLYDSLYLRCSIAIDVFLYASQYPPFIFGKRLIPISRF